VQAVKAQVQTFTRNKHIGDVVDQQVQLAQKQLALLSRYDEMIKVNDKTDIWLKILQSVVTEDTD
jgi:hypothetical protein